LADIAALLPALPSMRDSLSLQAAALERKIRYGVEMASGIEFGSSAYGQQKYPGEETCPLHD
jgi:hypothetical protein